VSSVHAHADVALEARPTDSGITIERDSHTQEFVIVHNRVARDKRLRRADRGLLIEILSLPRDTRITFAKLLECGPEGRDAVRGMIKRLVAAGYATTWTDHDKRTGRWTTRYKFYETPRTGQENTSRPSPAETQETPGQDRDVFTAPENPSPKDKDEEPKNDHHQTPPPVDNCEMPAAVVPDDDLTGDVRRNVKIQHGLDITDAEARHLIAAWRERAQLPPHAAKPLRWYETCAANEPSILALLPARPRAAVPPRGTCGLCDPRTAWLLDDHGYPDPGRPCPSCRACKAGIAA
jgi:hypothetical protein